MGTRAMVAPRRRNHEATGAHALRVGSNTTVTASSWLSPIAVQRFSRSAGRVKNFFAGPHVGAVWSCERGLMRCPAGEVDSEGEIHVLRQSVRGSKVTSPERGTALPRHSVSRSPSVRTASSSRTGTPIRPGRVRGRTLKLRESPCVPVGVSFVSWALTQSKCR